MKKILYNGFIIFLVLWVTGCKGQSKPNSPTASYKNNAALVGGGCDGCEIMYIEMPEQINAVDTSAGWNAKGQKLLVTGTVHQLDGKTPVADVIIYYWQTDASGRYTTKDGMDEKAARHGHLRGWIKTGADGRYAIHTVRPAPYPNSNQAAHIHLAVKEPGLNEYYIDELVFDDDRLLTGSQRKNLKNRGGSGILRVLISGDVQVAEHNIVVGLNIPNYPRKGTIDKTSSGLAIGEDSPSFIPYHAWGPDKGTRTCPVCKYGRFHGIVYFVGSNSNWDDIKKWLTYLEQESVIRSKYLKAYFVYGNNNNFNKKVRQEELEKIGTELKLKNIALTYVPSLTDEETEVHLNKINPLAENTFIIYRQRNIVDKYINLAPNQQNFKLITASLNNTNSAFFNLPEPAHN